MNLKPFAPIPSLKTLFSLFFTTSINDFYVKVIQLPSLLDLQIVIYCLYMTGTSFVVASTPLMLELAVEICYPVSESVVGGWFVLL